MEALKLAIIGCGAITEQGHLPAAVSLSDGGLEVVALVDRDVDRALRLAERHGVENSLEDYRLLPGTIDAAIVALPPALHAPVSIELLERGIHVLVEKPMGRDTAECDAMISAAEAGRATLAVGLVRRFQRGACFARELIAGGTLGKIERVDVREGGVFDWPVASAFFLDREAAGGGVLADAGVHALDLLLWWFGDASAVSYADDAFGGVEADCELELELGEGVRGRVELSRTRRMRNTMLIEGERGTLELGAYDDKATLTMKTRGGREIALAGVLRSAADENGAAITAQLRDFVEAVRSGREPVVSGREGRRSVALVEACYGVRQPLEHPWVMEGVRGK